MRSLQRLTSPALVAGLLLLKATPVLAQSLHSERGGLHTSPLAHRASLTATTLDPLRSLAISDHATVSPITARRVFEQLVRQAGGTGFTAEQLFRQLWDTQNPAPGQPDLPGGPHCSDDGNTVNGAPYPCRTLEGTEASTTTAALDRYVLVGLFNRFDLAPVDGAHCGEYRMSFARFVPAPQVRSRNRFILEGALPNPSPELGLEGCRPVAQAWAALSTLEDAAERRALLDALFFEGLAPGIPPVIHPQHYGDNPAGLGQVRVNMFMQAGIGAPNPWMLREFKLKRQCDATGCTLRFLPTTVKSTPRGDFFNLQNTHPLAVAFRDFFVTQVEALAVDDFNRFNYAVPDVFNAAQSSSMPSFGSVDDFLAEFDKTAAPTPFTDALQAELLRIGSPLTPRHLVARAQALSCGGCHDLSRGTELGGAPGVFPLAFLRFVQTQDILSPLPTPGPDSHYPLSPSLTTAFLPFRQQLLGAFLDTPALDARVVTTEGALEVQAGQPFQGTVTLENTGTTAWSDRGGLRATSLDQTADLGLSPGEAIHLGQRKTFVFTHTAPTSPGRTTYRWRLHRDGQAFGPPLSFTVDVP
ncbi:NBR1-Ig-like domain-containing protein [Myxococcus sp. MISCRS1]|uniref:NBR1-Ig-like domain-containing protein n=1 Tax=Myxococcus TaxID=32 RepID=UPI001CBB31E8|nr:MULTISPECIES: NBR1-Ig-like domain-containing protein [unclassified Myxococcus]MBZ4395045.1 hypothetical protein [Myxococcus sp. AS-1-15]MCY1002025.1 NBR1-Ig-like domain-containing protein [Myxococcus sp. MISCRS1]